ncbi:Calmodulin-2 [Mactra antiquata]
MGDTANTETDELTEEQIAELKESFSMFDKNGNGTIVSKELGTVMRSLGLSPTEADIKELLTKDGRDGNRPVDFSEFLIMVGPKVLEQPDPETELRNAFLVFDKEQTGYIRSEQLRHVMTNLGETLTDDEVNEMLQTVNIDEEGKVNYEDFVNTLLSTPSK